MYQINVALSENQIRKAEKGQTNLKLNCENLVGPHPLQVGKREFNKWNKAREKGTGVVIQTGGSLLGLAAAAAPMAAKALGLAGLSFGAEKLLKKIFGSGTIPPNAIQLAKMVEMLTQDKKKNDPKFSAKSRNCSRLRAARRFSWVACFPGNSISNLPGKKSFGKGDQPPAAS